MQKYKKIQTHYMIHTTFFIFHCTIRSIRQIRFQIAFTFPGFTAWTMKM